MQTTLVATSHEPAPHRHALPVGFRVASKPILGGLHQEYRLEKRAARPQADSLRTTTILAGTRGISYQEAGATRDQLLNVNGNAR
jgi:hypothetical protein